MPSRSQRVYSIKHGDARKAPGYRHAKEYRTWAAIKSRCHNPKAHGYASYGGRGIEVCQRWRESYAAFLEDMGRRPSDKHSIDRLDGNKGYYKDNCAWRTTAEQLKNRRNTRWIEVNGKRQTMTEWARELGLSNSAVIIDRLKRGWSEREAVTIPSLGRRKKAKSE